MAKQVDLTKTLKRKPSKEELLSNIVDLPVLHGQEVHVDALIAAKRLADRAEREFSSIRAKLEIQAIELRNETERKGFFHKKIVIPGTEDVVQMGFGDSFSALSDAEERSMRDALGENFKTLFVRETTYSVRDDKLTELRKLLKEAGHDPNDFVESSSRIVAKDDFRQNRFALRASLSEEANLALDTVIGHTQRQPALGGVKWSDTSVTSKKS